MIRKLMLHELRHETNNNLTDDPKIWDTHLNRREVVMLKNILMSKWHLIQHQPLLREIHNEPFIISYKRAKSLGDILIRAKL